MEQLTLFGEHQAARMAVEEHDLQVALERGHLTAHGGLTHVERVARVREAAGFGCRMKNPKLVPIHDGSNPGRVR